MPRGRRWSRDELLLAMNLYCRLPFGLFDQRNPEIIRVAEHLDRTPGSVAMKLCNLASLDPAHQQRGVGGLRHASRADREIWDAFHADWERMAVASEAAMEVLLGESEPVASESDAASALGERVAKTAHDLLPPDGPTEIDQTVRARRGQRFFRNAVLASYDARCAVTGNPVPDLLNASHILPWAAFPDRRVDPRNGICLAAHFDRAFDRGLVTFDPDARLVLSPRLRDHLPNEALEREFLAREGQPLRAPSRFAPAAEHIEYHRQNIFLGR